MKHVKYSGSHLAIGLYFAGLTESEYDVYLLEGAWPDPIELFTLCEGGDPCIIEQTVRKGNILTTQSPLYKIVKVFK